MSNIACKEMVPVLLAAATWGKSWAGQCVCFQSDNMAVVSVLRSGKAKDHTLAATPPSLPTFLLRNSHVHLHCYSHIAGKPNTAAYALSRNKLQLFLSTFPQADKSPTPIPQAARNLVFRGAPNWTSMDWREQFKASLTEESPRPPAGSTDQLKLGT